MKRKSSHAQRGVLAEWHYGLTERGFRLANTPGSGGISGTGKDIRVADTLGSEGPEQNRLCKRYRAGRRRKTMDKGGGVAFSPSIHKITDFAPVSIA